MQRNTAAYAIKPAQVEKIKEQMLDWGSRSGIVIFMDSNGYSSPYEGYECLLAVGGASHGNCPATVQDGDAGDLLTALQELHNTCQDWIFGHISYDYKNALEPKLVSIHPEKIGFPAVHFFVPQTVCYINREQTALTISSFDDTGGIYEAITQSCGAAGAMKMPELHFKRVIGESDYLDTIAKLRAHIGAGDCYEINFCTEGYCENVEINALHAFYALNALSPAPYAAWYRLNDRYMMCASPERYLRKEGPKIISQPIKGTARRDTDPIKDQEIKEALANDAKERSENVMIVDLVRNDLAHSCIPGTVHVDELFGIYSFPQVHQMISTVSGQMRLGAPFTDAIRHSFPMGSMTGAPKHKVMQLTELYERSARGLYAGAVGYITPGGDFDFNVVIRSLFYNAATQYLRYETGGAITYDSVAEREWEEMRLKAWALERVFGP